MNNLDLTTQRNVALSHHTHHVQSNNSGRLADSLSHNLSDKVSVNTKAAHISDKNYHNNQNVSIQTQEELDKQIKKLNESIGPLSTFIKFGVDKNNVFFVSVIDKKNDEVISRFPAAKAENIIQKLKEPIGIIFDTKG